jgi:putative proteasome-type protease
MSDESEMKRMTYCLGIVTHRGLVMASDSRTNSGFDQVTTCRKMHTFVQAAERVFVVLTSGSLSCSQSIVALLNKDFQEGRGLAAVSSMYEAARVVGSQVRAISDIDRPALERDELKFNVHMLLGGQVKGAPPDLYLIYPQGNPLRATEDSPYLQIGESKYGRPILDRGIQYGRTTLDEAAKYALISLDSTMRSNVTVGPPIDLLVYENDELRITRTRRFGEQDPDLRRIHTQWEQALRKAVQELPAVSLDTPTGIPVPPGVSAGSEARPY